MNFEEHEFSGDARQAEQHRKALIKLIGLNSHRHSTWEVFSDFCEMSALAISNGVDLPQREKREARYLEIVKRYSREEVERFPQMLGELVETLECGPDDVLGKVFHELELHNKYKGQFFTPYHVCRMMAKMTLTDDVRPLIEERGFVTAQEPACGSGAMVIALAHAMRDEGINYQQRLHVTATDLDSRCVHMAYVQLSLLHVPAIIQHGNTLSLEEFGRWHTPAHILGGWQWKIRPSRHNATLTDEKPEAPAALPAPEPVAAPDETPAKVIQTPTQAEPMQRRKPQQLTLF
ncbi:N-6 DNA methylase (plasmid) [Skermanella rosea]|uniref:N-6 DNA methylase n=1 Tax=Skermanella rosea TaxID=1817965 RepID=UPI0019348379|nr:N-6 DNA methylase [Skermanella rosea]UEM07992.1 N-6 DNA methylase [Skermanella rosea]